jgi:hypothetical protein
LSAGVVQGSFVPFLSLFNRIADGREEDFSDCIAVEHLASVRDSINSTGTLRVTAAHGQGNVDLSYNATAQYITFGIHSTSNWNVPADQMHLHFGLFWTGVLDNRTTHPLVMGKLQGV